MLPKRDKIEASRASAAFSPRVAVRASSSAGAHDRAGQHRYHLLHGSYFVFDLSGTLVGEYSSLRKAMRLIPKQGERR